MKAFIQKYKHAWVLSYGLIYITWFIYLERTVKTQYHVMHIALDDYIPFNEYFIVPYLLWFAYVGATIGYLFFTNKEDYYQLCFYLFSGMTISLIICTLFHNGTDFRPAINPDKNICSRIVFALYKTDTCTNVFPSVHVYNSICTHIAISKNAVLKQHRWLQVASFLLMASICLATVCLKQHSVIDGIGAGIMSYALYYTVYGSHEHAAQKVRPKMLG